MKQFLFCCNVILHNPTEIHFRSKDSASKYIVGLRQR